MKYFQFKKFLFHGLAYILINICYWLGIKLVDNYIDRDNIRSGDGNMGLFIALMVILFQIFIGIIISFILSFEKQVVKIYKTLTYILINSLILLFFLICYMNDTYKELTYIILGVFVIGSFVYSSLLRKYFSKI